jgi:elongation factor Ts
MSEQIQNLTELVKQLRAKSGAGIMACKKAIVEANGDVEKAYDMLLAKGEKMAESKADRSVNEGMLATISGDHDVAIVAVKCETDFVSSNPDFQNFVNAISKIAYENKALDVVTLSALKMGAGSVETERVALVSKVGENVQISECQYYQNDKGYEVVGKDIGMHVVAMNPLATKAKDVPSEIVERKQALFSTQVEKMGKPGFAQKIIDGKMAKFLKEVCLLDQIFVKEAKMTVAEYLKQEKSEVLHFIRVQLN